MTKKIALRKVDIDFKKIIKLNLNRKEWGKKHIIYALGDLTVTCEMVRFIFPRNEAIFRIFLECPVKNENNLIMDREISFSMNSMSLEFFENYLNKSIISGLEFDIGYFLKDMGTKKYIDLLLVSVDDRCIINAGFEDELKEIKNMSDMFKEDAIYKLEGKTKEVLNKPFNKNLNTFVSITKLDNENLYNFIDNLEESIKKFRGVL